MLLLLYTGTTHWYSKHSKSNDVRVCVPEINDLDHGMHLPQQNGTSKEIATRLLFEERKGAGDFTSQLCAD
jgi:hypothetical protein